MIGKGPILWGLSFFEGVLIFRFRASIHTLSSDLKVQGTISGLMCFWSAFWVSPLALIRFLIRSWVAGTGSSGISIVIVGFVPMISSCGLYLVCSCFQELCVKMAIGKRVLQLFCRSLTKWRRYPFTHWFKCSVCPSIRGWKAVLRFCWMSVALHTALEKCDVNRGSQSEMILFGIPNHGTRF
jgi:hypothetical protein